MIGYDITPSQVKEYIEEMMKWVPSGMSLSDIRIYDSMLLPIPAGASLRQVGTIIVEEPRKVRHWLIHDNRILMSPDFYEAFRKHYKP